MLQIFTVLDNIFVNGSSYRSLEVVVPFEEGIVHKPCYTGIKIDPLGCLSLVLSQLAHSLFFSSLEQVVEGKQVSDNSHWRGTVQFSPFHLGNSCCQWRSDTRLSFPMSAVADVPSTEPLEQVSLSKEKRGGHQSLVFKREQSGYKCAM